MRRASPEGAPRCRRRPGRRSPREGSEVPAAPQRDEAAGVCRLLGQPPERRPRAYFVPPFEPPVCDPPAEPAEREPSAAREALAPLPPVAATSPVAVASVAPFAAAAERAFSQSCRKVTMPLSVS